MIKIYLPRRKEEKKRVLRTIIKVIVLLISIPNAGGDVSEYKEEAEEMAEITAGGDDNNPSFSPRRAVAEEEGDRAGEGGDGS